MTCSLCITRRELPPQPPPCRQPGPLPMLGHRDCARLLCVPDEGSSFSCDLNYRQDHFSEFLTPKKMAKSFPVVWISSVFREKKSQIFLK